MIGQESMRSSASSSLSAISPSFTSYSSENLADIAARVVNELNLSPTHDPYDDDHDDLYSSVLQADPFHRTPPNEAVHNEEENNDDVEDDDESESEFEFAVLCGEDNSSPISADEIFSNGQIKPSYPLFNTGLVYGDQQSDETTLDGGKSETLRLSLRKLMKKDKENSNESSCSSSEGDELEGVPEGTYCVWAPKNSKGDVHEDEMMMKKKSKSTGSGSTSKRWRFRDLLYRSHSDGKDTFVFLTPSSHDQQRNSQSNGSEKRREKVTAVKGNNGYGGGKKRGVEEKKKSYLPYRQDLVGLFANVNGVSRTVRPF